MKKVIAIISILPIAIAFPKAQHYRAVYADKIAYFSDASGNIKCIRIDSVNGTTLFPFRNIQFNDSYCLTPYGPSWMGEKVVVNDSMSLFYNMKKEEIAIKTDALLNESWAAYHLSDSTTIMATVFDTSATSFIGQQDKVKKIRFQAYNKHMVPKEHPVNNMSITISENYGFIKTLNFYLFPELESYLPPYRLEEYDLVGLSEPRLGIQNLTSFDIYDFQAGDEIHVSYTSSQWGCGNDRTQINKTITRYLSRTDYEDSIVYDVEIWRSVQTILADTNMYSYNHFTKKSLILRDTLLDYLPDEPIISDYEAYSLYMTNGTNLSKTDPGYSNLVIVRGDDSCWVEIVADGCLPAYTYYKGLGGPYYSCSEFICFGGKSCDLVYYKKNDKTWGTPLVISDIPIVKRKRGIEVYPNPARDIITINASPSNLPFTFEIIDINGRTLLKKEINAEITSIKINEYLKKVYLYRIINNDKTARQGKLIVE
ncbi:MAG: T9SS type A sorting domain-containing protein [Bacteroidales bacterium]|nr:T9SS type A sorting domain-containing protein [Bacteroidales bacterium]